MSTSSCVPGQILRGVTSCIPSRPEACTSPAFLRTSSNGINSVTRWVQFGVLRVRERKRYVHISFDKGVADWVNPMVEAKTLGFESLTEFVVQAVREKLDHYLHIGLHPWSVSRKGQPKPETHTLPAALLVGLAGLVGVLGLLSLSAGITGNVVNPLRSGLDFLAFYNEQWFFIDLVIYTIIFVSAAYVTVGRMFGHRGIAIGVGLLLAVGMAGFEAASGFAIRDLGTLAAAFLTIVLGASLYHTFRKLHFDLFGAASTTLLLIYLGMIVMLPPVYFWLQRTFPMMGYAVTIIFLIGLYHLITKVAKERPTTVSLEPVPPELPEIRALYPELKEEEQIVQTYLSTITTRARKDIKTIITELTYVYHVLNKFGDSPESRQQIAKKLKELVPAEQDLDATLNDITKLTERIRSFDVKALGVRKAVLKKLGPGQRKSAQLALKEEFEKISAEDQVRELASKVATYKKVLLTQVNGAVQALNQGDVGMAKQALVEAI